MMKLSIAISPIFTTLFAAIVLFSFSAPSFGQYVWIDESGHKQFSDHPPPNSIPLSQILKQPDNPLATHSDSSPSTTEPRKQPDSVADQNFAYKKRMDELADKQKKEAGEAQATADKKENCRRMQEYKQSLDSGERIRQINATGEHSYMNDEQRAREKSDLQQHMQDCDG